MDRRDGEQLMAKRYIGDTNIFDPSTVSLDTRIYWNTGQEFQAAGWSITDYIPVNQGWSYHSGGLLKYMIVGYDENKQYLGVYNATIDSFDKSGAATNTNSFTNSSAYGVSYIRLYSNFYFSQGFEFYENAHWEPCAVKRYHKSPNLIDESKITNELLDISSGTTTPDSNYKTTDYIILPKGLIHFSIKGGATSGGKLCAANYDENKQYIDGRFVTLNFSVEQQMWFIRFIKSSSTGYSRFCWFNDSQTAEPMLELNDEEYIDPVPYEPYSTEVWHDADESIRQNGVWVQQ